MKKILLIMSSLLFVAGCSETKTEYPAVQPERAVRFTGSGASATRTAFGAEDTAISIAWTDDDEIGIFGRGAVVGDNYPYAAMPDRKEPSRCVFVPAGIEKIFAWGNGEQHFYAVWPYDEEAAGAPEEYPVSLPAVQEQSEPGSVEHLAAYSVMKAAPVSRILSEEEASGVDFAFHSLFAIVELRLKMDASSSLEVPIRQIRLVSTAADLTIPAGTVDLTAPVAAEYDELPVTALTGSREATLSLPGTPSVLRSEFQSFYLTVAPGTHPEGALSLEITAIDNSVCTVPLPAATFKSNRNYRRDATLRLEEFAAADPFTVTTSTKTCKVGEPVVFEMTGTAETVDFYSGEMFHEWAYAKTDRVAYPDIFFSFKAQLQAGTQIRCFTVKVSTDFDGTCTEESINKATWTDISNNFTLPTKIWTSNDGPTKVGRYEEAGRMIPSGEASLSAYYGASTRLYVALFYHIDAWDAGVNNVRTGVWFTDIRADRVENGTRTVLFSQMGDTSAAQAAITIVNGANILSSSGTSSGWGANCKTQDTGLDINAWRFWCDQKKAVPFDAWAVMSPVDRVPQNFGPDKPEVVKRAADAMPTAYSYTFAEPGTYTMTVVGTSRSLTGDVEIVREFVVTVNP